MPDTAQEARIIRRLCAVWSACDHVPAFPVCWPDHHGVEGACDAIVCRLGGMWAVEHTRVETRPERQKYLRRLTTFGESVKAAIHSRFPHDNLLVSVDPQLVWEAPDQPALAERIAAECAERIPNLRPGTGWQFPAEPGGPFAFMVYLVLRGQREGRIHVGPYGPSDEDAAADMRRALQAKYKKMARYRADGFSTALLLEAQETDAFHGYFWQRFLDVAEAVPHDAFDDVILAGSIGEPAFLHYLKRSGSLVRSGAEYADFVDAQAQLDS